MASKQQSEWGDFAEPSKSYKSLGTLISSLHYYFEQWPLGADGFTPVKDGIECMFAFDLPILHPDTGKPLQYAGRYDMLATEDATGSLFVIDEKTTSRLGDQWVWQWNLDPQITGYMWSVRKDWVATHGVFNDDEMPNIRGQIRGVSILKDSNGHVEVPIVRPQWMIDRWYVQLLVDVSRMIDAYAKGDWSYALDGNSCVQYGRQCEFMPLCLSPNPERIIPEQYKVVVWNPLEVKK